MNRPKVSYKDFNPARLVKQVIVGKTSKPKPKKDGKVDTKTGQVEMETIQYQLMEIKYKYDVKTKEGKDYQVIDDLRIEGPARGVYSPSGIRRKAVGDKGFESAAMYTLFDMTNPDINELLKVGERGKPETWGTFEKLYRTLLDFLFEERNNAPSIKDKYNKMLLEGVFKYPIMWDRGSDGEIIPGSKPKSYFNLLCYGITGTFSRKETKFSVPLPHPTIKDTFQTLKWPMLENVQVEHQPIWHFMKVTVAGGKASIQYEIEESVVKSISPINADSSQTETLKQMQTDADLMATITQQVELLTKRYEDAKQLEAEKKEGGEKKDVPVDAQGKDQKAKPAPPEPVADTKAKVPPAPEPAPAPGPTPTEPTSTAMDLASMLTGGPTSSGPTVVPSPAPPKLVSAPGLPKKSKGT